MQAIVTLGVVALIAVGIVYLQRKSTLGGMRGPLELVGRLPLDARKAIYLVKVGEQVLVLGGSEAGLRLLSTVAAQDLPKTETGQRSLAESLLRRLGSSGSTAADPISKPSEHK